MTNKDLHAILVYGHSGYGKSTWIAAIVRELLKKLPEGSKARIVTAEHYSAYDELCAEGLAELWKINMVDHPFESARFAMDGFWPSSVAANGIADPFSKLTKDRGKALINVFEGVFTIGQYIAGSYAEGGLADRIGKGESFGPADAKDGPTTLQDGSVSMGKLSSNNYGFIQGNLYDYINRSQRLGGYNIWSTHEDDVEEKIGNERTKTVRKTGKLIIGPQGFGAAMTQTLGINFSNMWRITEVPMQVPVQGQKDRLWIERRLYVKEHICPTHGVIAKAKNSGKGDDIPEYFRLTDKEEGRQGLRRKDAAEVVVGRLGL